MSDHPILPLLIDAANRALGDGDAARAAVVTGLAQPVPEAVAERVVRALRSFPGPARAEVAHALLDGTPGLWHILVRDGRDEKLLVELFRRADADPIASATLVGRLLHEDVKNPSAYVAAIGLCRRWRNHDGFCTALAHRLESEDLAGGFELLGLLKPERSEAEHAVLDALTDYGVSENRQRLLDALTGPAPGTAAYFLAWQAARGDDYEPAHCLPCAAHHVLLSAFVRQVEPSKYVPHLDALLVFREADAQGALEALYALIDWIPRDHKLELIASLGRHGKPETLRVLDPIDDGWFAGAQLKRAVADAMAAIRDRHGAGSVSLVEHGGGLSEAE